MNNNPTILPDKSTFTIEVVNKDSLNDYDRDDYILDTWRGKILKITKKQKYGKGYLIETYSLTENGDLDKKIHISIQMNSENNYECLTSVMRLKDKSHYEAINWTQRKLWWYLWLQPKEPKTPGGRKSIKRRRIKNKRSSRKRVNPFPGQ